MRRMRVVDAEDIRLTVYFQIPSICNMRPPCHYCGTLSDRVEIPSLPCPSQDWWRAVSDLETSHGPMRLCFAFGEPYADIDLVRMLGVLTERNIVDTMTNMLVTRQCIEQYFIDPRNACLGATFHPHAWPSIDDFISEVGATMDLGVRSVSVFILGHPSHIPHLDHWRGKIADQLGLTSYVTPFLGMHEGRHYPSDYTEEELAKIKGMLIECYGVAEEVFSGTKGSLCRCGMDFIYVRWNGDVTSCPEWTSYPLGNLYQGTLEFLAEPMPCRSQRCTSPDMLRFRVDGSSEESR